MTLKSYLAKTLHLTATMDTFPETCSADNSTAFAPCITVDDIEELKEYSSLAGSMRDTVTRFMVSPEHLAQIWMAISAVVVWEELLFFFSVGFLVPIAFRRSKNSSSESSETTSTTTIGLTIAHNIAQVAQLAFCVYVVDIVKVILQSVGFELSEGDLAHAFANILYMVWFLNRVSALKRYLIARHTHCSHHDLTGQAELVDRMIDAFLYCIGIYSVVDYVQDDMGAAARGFVALGSVGTMVIGLASQGLAAQLFNGLFLASSNRIAVGDVVKFGNGVSGKVIKLGWMQTVLRAPDESLMTVPNKDLADQRVTNMTRVQQSCVKQTLRFKYTDIDKLPEVLESIKEEVKKACPEVITDGTRPFRAYLTGYHSDHVAAQLDFRFRIKPLGDAFHRNRQTVLLLISKVAKQHGVEFAVVDVAALSTAMKLLAGESEN